ncbi:MAG: GNAT family N-acetyltransferase [Marinilabiliales bacterium]|nr:MAG: GNAT family N-acetyltransferase [Marinilabiliales bacterium]
MRIRLATEDDKYIIAKFQVKMAKETENIDLDPEIVENGVMSVFQDSHKGKYMVAEAGEDVIASLLLTYEWSDWRNSMVLWIQSVYVLPDYRGKGVFRMLYNYVKEIATEDKSVSGIRLYVDKTNTNAMKVYSAIGMNGEHYNVFEWMK